MPVDPGPSLWGLPDPAQAPPGVDLVAVGADLAPSTVLAAYRAGLFPMHVSGPRAGPEELGWWSPDPRGVLPLGAMRVTRSLLKSMRRFTLTLDADFGAVMAGCAEGRDDGAWITREFLDAYGTLHDLGWAHSIEVWQDGDLVGGLYGIEIGGLFAGESMFHRVRDASKAALVGLVDLLAAAGSPDERLLDVQWRTDHLATLGVVEVPRAEYLRRLQAALEVPPALGAPWPSGRS